MAPDARLQPFLDAEGRFRRWPVKRAVHLQALACLAREFEAGRRYSEREVNDLLDGLHTFRDAPRLRCALCDWQFLGRQRDGSAYWLITYGLVAEEIENGTLAGVPVKGLEFRRGLFWRADRPRSRAVSVFIEELEQAVEALKVSHPKFIKAISPE